MTKIKITMLITSFLVASLVRAKTEIERVSFISHEVKLAGSIVWPDSEIKAAVVFVHGSGEQQRNLAVAERFAEDGIAALVYDKRGVGESGGEYESKQSVSGHNIELLANDALAALGVLVKRDKLEQVPLGLTGISQAGWIVPLAAAKSNDVDFMVLWSGPVAKVSEEDIYSKFTQDFDGDDLPSFEMALNSRKTPYIWPDFLGEDTSPTASLKKLKIPGLWVFGKKDGSIPVDLSMDRLNALISDDYAYEYILLSRAGHNNMRETFVMVNDWVVKVANSIRSKQDK